MKFSINRQLFLNQLTDVSRAISGKSPIEVLTGVKLEVLPNQLILTGSDSEISIVSVIESSDENYQLNIESTGSIILPARIFNEIIRKLPHNQLTIETQPTPHSDSLSTLITCGKVEFNLSGIPGENYPHLPEIETDSVLDLSTTVFKQLINQTIFSVSSQENRPILTGIHFIYHPTHLTAIATDSHRLSRRELPFETQQKESLFDSITIPKKTMAELSRIMPDNKVIRMMVAQQQVIFSLDNITIYSRLLEGVYPDAERLIPTEFSTSFTVNAHQFLTSIERASLLSHDGSKNIVQLDITSDNITLFGNRHELGKVVEEVEFKEKTGDFLKISFNPEYMKDALKAFGETDIRIILQSAVRPLLLELATPSDSANNTLIQLLTPIRTH